MKKVMGTVENLFCAGYLLFAFVAGCIFLSHGGPFYSRCAVMTFLLASGDAFHLIPRIASNLKPAWTKKQFWLGLGNLISSITMTVFYVVLAYVMARTQGRMSFRFSNPSLSLAIPPYPFYKPMRLSAQEKAIH